MPSSATYKCIFNKNQRVKAVECFCTLVKRSRSQLNDGSRCMNTPGNDSTAPATYGHINHARPSCRTIAFHLLCERFHGDSGEFSYLYGKYPATLINHRLGLQQHSTWNTLCALPMRSITRPRVVPFVQFHKLNGQSRIGMYLGQVRVL